MKNADDVIQFLRNGPRREASEWPEPVDFSARFNPPVMPLDALPAAIGNYVRASAADLGVDPSLVGLACLVVAASQLSDAFKIRPIRSNPGWQESARIWGMGVGLPSSKKTPALEKALSIARKIDRDFQQVADSEIREYKLQEAIYKKREKAYVNAVAKGQDADRPIPPTPPKVRRTVVNDATIEALTEILALTDHGCLVYRDELAGFFGAMDAYRNAGANKDRSSWLEAYNGGPMTIDRIGRGKIRIDNWSACLLGGIQPEPLQRIVAKGVDDGLLQRFLVVVPRRATLCIDGHYDPEAIDAWERIVMKMAGMVPPAEPFVLSREAKAIRDRRAEFHFSMQQIEIISRPMAIALAKWDGTFARLLLLMHVAEHAQTGTYPPNEVSGETAERTERLMSFFFDHLLFFYTSIVSSSENTSHADWLAGYILARKMDSLTIRDIVRAYRALRNETQDEIRAAVEPLVSFGWAAPVAPVSGKVTTWRVNPRVHELFEERAEREKVEREAQRAALAEVFDRMKHNHR